MEVTSANFSVIFPKFVEHLSTAEFIALDCEMTGVDHSLPTVGETCPFMDPPSVQFPKKNEAAKKYGLIQLGITLFHRLQAVAAPVNNDVPIPLSGGSQTVFVEDDEEEGALNTGFSALSVPPPTLPAAGPQPPNKPERFEARSFNFYLFPTDDRGDLVLNIETARFLSSHGMDFSKWISQGIPFATVEQAARLRQEAMSTPEAAWSKRAPTPEDSYLFANIQARAEKLAASKRKSDQFELPFLKDQSSLGIIADLLSTYGLNVVKIVTETGKRRGMVVCGANPGKASAAAAVDSKIGATLLFEALVRQQPLVIIHNGLADLLMLYYAFHEQPLEDYQAFKQAARNMFHRIVDTRLLFTLPWSSRESGGRIGPNLSAFYQHLHPLYAEKLQVELPLGFEQYNDFVRHNSNRGTHEAAYDAYLTGCLYLYLLEHLGQAEVKKYINHIAVYGCVSVCALEAEVDPILHTGDVLWLRYPPGRSIGSLALEGGLRTAKIEARVLWSFTTSVAFCRNLGTTKEQLMAAQRASGALVSVVWPQKASA